MSSGALTLSEMTKRSSKELPVAPLPRPPFVMPTPPVVVATKPNQQQLPTNTNRPTPLNLLARVTPKTPVTSSPAVISSNSTRHSTSSAPYQSHPHPLADSRITQQIQTPSPSTAVPATPSAPPLVKPSITTPSQQQPCHPVVFRQPLPTAPPASIFASPMRRSASASTSAPNPIQDSASPVPPIIQERKDIKMEQGVIPSEEARVDQGWLNTPPRTLDSSTIQSPSSEIVAPTHQVASLSIAESGPTSASAVMSTPTADATNREVIIKDESEDELMEEGVVTESATEQSSMNRSRASSVKAEHQEIREAVRENLKNIYPVQAATILPQPQWATSLVEWLKGNALQNISNTETRIEILMACFDEFYYCSWTRVNPDYSVSRACLTINLLLLDLYYALSEVEECQAALVNLFYHRIFHPSAVKIQGPHTWPPYELCAAATIVIPSRPSWLITQVCQRNHHFSIEQVPSPLEKVVFNFTRMRELLRRVTSSQKLCDREPSIRPFLNSLHSPFIDLKTFANLRTLYRQSQTRLTPEVKKIVEVSLESQLVLLL